MTDLEWDDSDDPAAMVRFLLDFEPDRVLKRKLRLFIVAACHRVWHFLPFAPFRDAVDGLAAFVDGQLGERKLRSLAEEAEQFWQSESDRRNWWRYRHWQESQVIFTPAQCLGGEGVCGLVRGGVADTRTFDYLRHLAAAVVPSIVSTTDGLAAVALDELYLAERAAQAELLRELFGNPYWRQPADPRWLTRTTCDLARLIGRDHRYDLLPILADALLDVGCDDERMILHCHGSTFHVQGCWVGDLLLEK